MEAEDTDSLQSAGLSDHKLQFWICRWKKATDTKNKERYGCNIKNSPVTLQVAQIVIFPHLFPHEGKHFLAVVTLVTDKCLKVFYIHLKTYLSLIIISLKVKLSCSFQVSKLSYCPFVENLSKLVPCSYKNVILIFKVFKRAFNSDLLVIFYLVVALNWHLLIALSRFLLFKIVGWMPLL